MMKWWSWGVLTAFKGIRKYVFRDFHLILYNFRDFLDTPCPHFELYIERVMKGRVKCVWRMRRFWKSIWITNFDLVWIWVLIRGLTSLNDRYHVTKFVRWKLKITFYNIFYKETFSNFLLNMNFLSYPINIKAQLAFFIVAHRRVIVFRIEVINGPWYIN